MHHLEPGTTLNARNFFGTTGQLAWFENDLKQVTIPECRVKVPWIVAAGHRPFFGSTVKPQLEIDKYIQQFSKYDLSLSSRTIYY
jgi:hypothetical protein